MPPRKPATIRTPNPLAPLAALPARWARLLFTQHLRIQRSQKGLKVVFSRPTGGKDQPASVQPSDETVQTLIMHTDLKSLLDGVPRSRKVLRHLAAVEHGLEHKDPGGLFLFDVPTERLNIALRQLDGLLPGSLPPGIVALRARMVDAIEAREARERQAVENGPPSTFVGDHKLQVFEARASDFDKESAAWNSPAPPDKH